MEQQRDGRPDHRELNHDLAVYTTDPMVGSGLPLWLPAGAAIRQELERFAAEIARADGCVGVYSPVLAKRSLYEQSGHWEKFADDMFPPMPMGEEELVLRPANCPHHAVIYRSQQRSYRELPIRLNELGSMFRSERSGVVSGLNRVRQISLDDTHVFCRPDQVADEVDRALRSAIRAQQVLGLPVDRVRLSRRDASESFLGSAEQWAASEDALRDVAERVTAAAGLSLVDGEGEAAFYGPKLDLQVVGRGGRDETIATVQLDFNQPERFDLSYVGADGADHRVVMIHRGTVGSMERVVAALLEHYDGRLPLWLSPIQLCVMPVGEAQDRGARRLVDEARALGLRAHLELEGSLGARIRRSRTRRDAVIAVIGEREAAAGAVEVTDPAADVRGAVSSADLLERLRDGHRGRSRLIAWPELARSE